MSGSGKDRLDGKSGDPIGRNIDPTRARFDKRGKNTAVGATEEDMWSPGGRMTWLTSEDTLDVVSSSSSDTSGGVGAQIILIYGVDENYNIVSELVTLNGTSSVTTTANFFRVNSAQFVFAGSTGYNIGNITITDTSGGSTQGYIEAEIGVHHSMNFAVPVGYHIVLESISVASETNQDVELFTYIRAPGAGLPFWACYTDELVPGGKTTSARIIPSLIPEKTDVNIRVKKTSGSSGICQMSYIGYKIKGDEGVSTTRPFNIGL